MIERGPWIVQLNQQWTGLFTPTNWTDFTVIHIEGEHDEAFGNVNFTLALLGLHLFVRYTYDDDSEGHRRVEESMREMGL